MCKDILIATNIIIVHRLVCGLLLFKTQNQCQLTLSIIIIRSTTNNMSVFTIIISVILFCNKAQALNWMQPSGTTDEYCLALGCQSSVTCDGHGLGKAQGERNAFWCHYTLYPTCPCLDVYYYNNSRLKIANTDWHMEWDGHLGQGQDIDENERNLKFDPSCCGVPITQHIDGTWSIIDWDDNICGMQWDSDYRIYDGYDGGSYGGHEAKFDCDGNADTFTINYIAPPTPDPTFNPSPSPTEQPTPAPTEQPSSTPTANPSSNPTKDPTTMEPSSNPTKNPTKSPNNDPTTSPITMAPTSDPSTDPTKEPTTNDPTTDPTTQPTDDPTKDPTSYPTIDPTSIPSIDPTSDPTTNPTNTPSLRPTELASLGIDRQSPTSNPTLTEEGELLNEGAGSGTSTWLILGLVVLFLLLLAFFGFCMDYYKRKRMEIARNKLGDNIEPGSSINPNNIMLNKEIHDHKYNGHISDPTTNPKAIPIIDPTQNPMKRNNVNKKDLNVI